MTELYRQVIYGEPCSKANSRKLVVNKNTGKAMFIKSKDALAYVNMFIAQTTINREPITKKVVLVCDIYYKSERKDLDESLIMDCLEKSGIIRNDRQIREKHIYHHIDKIMPRAEIKLFERE